MPIFLTDIAKCESSPCQNGTVCTEIDNGYTCACVDGYTGVNCETGKIAIPKYCFMQKNNWP